MKKMLVSVIIIMAITNGLYGQKKVRLAPKFSLTAAYGNVKVSNLAASSQKIIGTANSPDIYIVDDTMMSVGLHLAAIQSTDFSIIFDVGKYSAISSWLRLYLDQDRWGPYLSTGYYMYFGLAGNDDGTTTTWDVSQINAFAIGAGFRMPLLIKNIFLEIRASGLLNGLIDSTTNGFTLFAGGGIGL